jgi:transposase
MTDHSHSTGEANLVAIDIAKEWNVVLVQEINGAKRTFKVANNAADHNQLLLYLSSLSGRTRVALEPTGDFHRPLAFRLLQAGFEVVSISSVAQARFREARYGTWDKNDPKDARVILAMLAHGLVQTYHDPLFHGTHDWQELSNTYYQVTLARTRLQHSLLLHYLPLYFPEFGRYWYSTRSEWFIRFLVRFPIPSAVRALTRDDFIHEAWDIVGKKWDKRAKLEEIYELAACSIGLPVELHSPAVETFRLQLERYAEINERRSWLDRRAQELLADNQDFQRLIQLPGVAAITALTILAEAGDMRRFHHHRQFLKYCGLDLAKSQSGQSRGKETLSKRGNKRLRMVFWLAGLRAIHLRENEFRSKYQRYLNSNPLDADRKRKALTAIAAKMARVAYAVVKHGTDYQPFFEQRLPSGSIPLTRAVEALATS